MPIDPRIALGVQAPQIESPMNVMANALKLRAMQNENALFEQQQRQAAVQEMERNRLRSLLAGGASPEQLMRAGFFEQGAELGEFGRQQSAEERAQAEEKRKAEEAAASRRKAMFGVLSVAKNPETYRTAREIAQGMGLDLTGIPEEFPGVDYINTLENSLLTPQERADRAARERTARIQEGQLRVSQGQLGVSQGQLDVSRGRLELERDKEAREAAKGPEGRKPPENYEYAPDGTLRFIKGGPADPDTVARLEAAKRPPGAPKTTEQERRDAYNAQRLLSSLRSVKGAIAKDPSAASPGALEAAALSSPFGIFEPAANIVRGNQRQIVAAAQSDAIDALLYLATGAAYNREQLEAQRQSYLVNFTDREAVRKDKRKRLEDLVEAAKVRAGNAWTPELEAELQDVLTPPGSAPKAAAAPAGVSADVWGAMTPEERALWQNKR